MGCGASKSPPPAVVPQAKDQKPQAEQAAASVKAGDGGPTKSTSLKRDDVPPLSKAPSVKRGTGDGTADPPEAAISKCADDEGPQRTSSRSTDSGSQRPGSASQIGASERPGSGQGPEDPARAAFRARFQGSASATGEDPLPSPMTFKSSRSLNRSIGVRRRESDSGSQGSDKLKAAAASGLALKVPPDDDDDVTQSPDSLVERFERTKGVNPLLRKATANGMSGRHSEKSAPKSQKRLMFADDPKEDDKGGSFGATVRARGDSASETEDIDPEQHMEAERIASVGGTVEAKPVVVVAGPGGAT